MKITAIKIGLEAALENWGSQAGGQFFPVFITDIWKVEPVVWIILTVSMVILFLAIGIKAFRYIAILQSKDEQIELLIYDNQRLEKNNTQSSAKNEWLVTEMHHRVKNNLQILSSLINSQLAYSKDKTGKEVLFQSKHRLYALSLVHQKLFQNAGEPIVEMSCSIKDLVDYLIDEFNCRDKVNFKLDLQSMKADSTIAIPFALILNELISNTLRFAFPGTGEGFVKISLSTKDEIHYRLTYSDNGIGLPEDEDFFSGRSLGKALIIGLSKQIKGDVKVMNETGFGLIIDFNITQEQQNHFAAN